MTDWKVLDDPRMSEIFDYLGKKWEVEARYGQGTNWRPVRISEGGNQLIFDSSINGDYLHVARTRQWRVREPQTKWHPIYTPAARDITGLLAAGCRVQVQHDAGSLWYDVRAGDHGVVRYDNESVGILMRATDKWRYAK